MSAAEQGGMAWEDRLRQVRELLDQAAKMPDALDREAAAVRTLTSALLDRTDQLAVTQLWGIVKASRLLGRESFDAAVKDRRQAERDARTSERSLARVIPLDVGAVPPHELPVSADGWRYAEGGGHVAGQECRECSASECERGVYLRGRLVAPLPYCHARIVRRDGTGARAGTDFLLSAEVGGARLIMSHAKIKDGSWANELGVPLPDDRKVSEAAGTAIREIAERAPEREAIMRAVRSGELAVPPVECMPAGYLAVPDVPEAEALGTWAHLAALAARTPALAHALGASAFGPFVGPLRIQSHLVDLFGGSDQGKSTTLRLAAAVWGDSVSEGGTFQTWNFAPVGLLRALGRLGILPMFIDESGMAGFSKEQWRQAILRLTGSASRTGAEYRGDGNRASLPWNGTLFITGNARVTDGITEGAANAGIPKRVIESEGPFTVDAEHAEAIDVFIPMCYGFLGREILARYSVADARRFADAAAELVELPSGGIPRTWAQELHGHIAGAMMIDEILELPAGMLTRPVAEFAAAYLAERCAGPRQDADRLLDALVEAQAREPSRWPTVEQYRANRGARDWSAGGQVAELPPHRVHASIAGVIADDRSWFAVWPGYLAEVVERLGADQTRTLAELYVRGALIVSEARRRGGHYLTGVRVMPKGAAPLDYLYRFAMPSDDDDDQDDDAEAPSPAGPNYIPDPSRATRVFLPETPETPETSQVRGQIEPETPLETHWKPDGNPTGNPTAEAAGQLAEAPELPADARPDQIGPCRRCGVPTVLYGPRGRPLCDRCSPPPGDVDQAAAPDSAVASAPAPEAPPTRPASSAAGPRFLVLGGDGRAYGPEGVIVPAPELAAFGRCRDVGRLAELALRLGCRDLWVPRPLREALGLPAELPPPASVRAGFPHAFTDGASPEQWDIWPGEPVGLGAWMDIYRVPRSGDGAHIVFPEWLDRPSDSAPALGELAPAELANALTLIWKSTVYEGGGGRYGGVHFNRSAAKTFTLLLESAARRSRKGTPPPVVLPPPFNRDSRVKGAPPLILPRDYMAPAQEIPEGWIIAQLDVRRCYLSAARSTPVGFGEARKIRPGELSKLPGVHLVRAPAEAASIDPALFGFLPSPRPRQREVGAWLDTAAAAWLAECGVPLRVDESYVWDGGRRVFDSAAARVLAALDELSAAEGAPELVAAAVLKSGYQRALGGWIGSDFAGGRAADDWTFNRAAWLAIRVQAEVRKQRNVRPMIGAGIRVLGAAQVDSVYVAAPSIEALAAAPGTGGRPAIAEGAGKFKIEATAVAGAELAGVLADSRASWAARLGALREALGGAQADDKGK